ncbi:MAG: DUF362 domain-containing protein [Candidatus Heimdallarchaeota archaeon]|nr:DUF362 domain-containing protein [Candidatus Heimdallarchaeota archaeon]
MLKIVNDIVQMQEVFLNYIEELFGKNPLANKKVFLKPNMGYPKKAPFTTSIELIKGIVEIAINSNAKEILIGEGSTSTATALENFKVTGLIDILKEYNVEFIDLNTQESSEVILENGSKHFLPNLLKEMDLRISLPVIKYYNDNEGEFFLSNAIKNFFGLPPKEKYKIEENSYKRDNLHTNLHQSVAEVFQAVEKFSPFHLYVCDGLLTLFGFADEGKPKEWGKILLADNALEADQKILEIMDKSPPKFLEILTRK